MNYYIVPMTPKALDVGLTDTANRVVNNKKNGGAKERYPINQVDKAKAKEVENQENLNYSTMLSKFIELLKFWKHEK